MVREEVTEWESYCRDRQCPSSEQDYLGPILRLPAPSPLKLFAVAMPTPLGWIDYRLLLFDSAKNVTTSNGPRFWGRWLTEGTCIDEKIETPLVGFRDVDGDGRPDLFVEHCYHRGTDDLASAYDFYSIEKTVELEPLFSYERERFYWHGPDYHRGTIRRTVRPTSPLTLEMTAVFVEQDHPTIEIGRATFTRPGPHRPYVVTSCSVRNEYATLQNTLDWGDISYEYSARCTLR
jgi:hypothetical protein